MRTKLALLAVLGVTSCDEGCWLSDYTFVREGEHVTIYGYDVDESEACAGSFDAVDEYTTRIRAFLGVEAPERYYYLWMSDEFFDGLCVTGAAACAEANTLLTPNLPDGHELTHVIADGEWGEATSFLAEGLATYLGDAHMAEVSMKPEWVQPGQVYERLTQRTVAKTWVEYSRAGHFVSFLVEYAGVERLGQLYSRLPPGSSLHDWERSVAEVYDTTLDELLTDYAKYPLCSPEQYRAKLWDCDRAPDFVFTSTQLEFEVEAGCSDPRAVNWLMAGVFVPRLVEFTEPTRVRTRVEVDGEQVFGYPFMATECAPCSKNPRLIKDTIDDWLDIEPGRYMVLLTLDPELGSTISLTMTAEG